MENDPNKKESKGKRILKKALRRSSKASTNSSQSNGVESTAGVSRSKSLENGRRAGGVNDSAPLPTPDGPADKAEPKKKIVDIQEQNNEFFKDPPTPSKETRRSSLKIDPADPSTSKKNLKRKLEEESCAGTSGASTGASDTDADDKDAGKDKKKKNRCAVCRKKVGLTGFECRCGGLFCAVHRYSDKHECSFDYRELGAQEIRRNNPVVVSQKIHKI